MHCGNFSLKTRLSPRLDTPLPQGFDVVDDVVDAEEDALGFDDLDAVLGVGAIGVVGVVGVVGADPEVEPEYIYTAKITNIKKMTKPPIINIPVDTIFILSISKK